MRFTVVIMLAGCGAVTLPLEPNDSGVETQTPVDAGVDPIVDAGHDAGLSAPDASVPTTVLTAAEQMLISKRPYRTVVPVSYDGGTAVPFVMLLHGYMASGSQIDTYFKLSELAQQRGFILATPDGEKDVTQFRYWNATDYCCGTVIGSKPDDVAYLTAIMNDVQSRYRVDAKRVFFIGHSNGGFMSHRMACDRASRVAAIVSFAGAQWKDVSHCAPSEHVSVLEVHGDADFVVQYGGGGNYASAAETTRDWAGLDGCGTTTGSGGADLDLTSDVGGNETQRERYAGCPSGTDVELWTMKGAGHQPGLKANAAATLFDFLMAHPKP